MLISKKHVHECDLPYLASFWYRHLNIKGYTCCAYQIKTLGAVDVGFLQQKGVIQYKNT